MFWQEQEDGNFKVIADWVTPDSKASVANRRGDDWTFPSQCRWFRLPADGDGPVATVARTGDEIVIKNASECDIFRRKTLAAEFGIDSVHFVKVEGGVLEYGTP